jgi:hypothetical protein
MKTLKEVRLEEETFPNISLKKLCGSEIDDIEVCISQEFGDLTLKLYKIILKNGEEFYVEGEHDHPYLTNGNVSQEQLESLNTEIKKEYENS